MSYVTEREAALKAQYHEQMWWIQLGKLWANLSEALCFKREADYNMEKYNAIRSRYIRKGRGPAKVKAPQ